MPVGSDNTTELRQISSGEPLKETSSKGPSPEGIVPPVKEKPKTVVEDVLIRNPLLAAEPP